MNSAYDAVHKDVCPLGGLMELIKTIREMKNISCLWRKEGLKIGFVPTMGALHKGHLSLVEISKKNSDKTVFSIFVNPSQFGPNEDFNKYPRNLEKDLELAKMGGVDVVFSPEGEEIYPRNFRTGIEIKGLSSKLCGQFRPGHFNGAAIVVLKLFNIISPDVAIFGEKDFQQLAIIKRMVHDLNLDIEIIPAPTVRESDGLALSSRNIYLSSDERKSALSIFRGLEKAQELVRGGERISDPILKNVRNIIESTPHCRIQYVAICSDEALDEISIINAPCCLVVAVFCGNTRLIDNIELDPNEKTII